MNVAPPAEPAATLDDADAVIDCDIHPHLRSPEDLKPYLSRRWWDHWTTHGDRVRHGLARGTPYPKMTPGAMRRDAWPEDGPPGSDLALMRAQHLDPNRVAMGVLNPLSPTGGDRNAALSAALCSALNDWMVESWTRQEPRLKASIMVSYEDGAAAAAEIRRRAGQPDFVQVLLLSRTSEPLGKARYRPIFEAAAEAGLPVALHVFGYGGHPSFAGGWPSYYLEEGANHAGGCQASIASLVFEGVFDAIPGARLLVIEAGFAWLPALCWRLDRLWRLMRDEVPHVSRPPSEIIRERVWLSSQPMEEALDPEHVVRTMDRIGADRLLYASDYPHWDFDDPRFGLPARLDAPRRAGLRRGAARRLYGLLGR